MGGVRVRRPPLTLLVGLALSACGQNRDLPPPPPLGPELYVIDEDDRPATGQFLRFVPATKRGGGLDIAITEYTPADSGPTVDLVGVVHVADGRYYEEIQRALDAYDAVLYEGVIPAGMKGVDWQKQMLQSSGDLGQMQQEIALWFGLRYQMEAIDYGRANLIHADMSVEQFAAAGAARLGLAPAGMDSDPEPDDERDPDPDAEPEAPSMSDAEPQPGGRPSRRPTRGSRAPRSPTIS